MNRVDAVEKENNNFRKDNNVMKEEIKNIYKKINDINGEMKIHKIKLGIMEERLEEIEFMDKFKYN